MADAAQKKPSKSAAYRSARLVAVQAQYEIIHRGANAKDVAGHYVHHAQSLTLHGEPQVPPDLKLMKSIMDGVEERKADLLEVLANTLEGKISENKDIEILLKAILLCASYELMAHHDIDAPIILNDYLDITHAFYEPGETKLVNGVLDKIAKLFRD